MYALTHCHEDILMGLCFNTIIFIFAAVWGAVRDCYPGYQVFGCGFHWVQCLRRKYRKLGLGAFSDATLKKCYNRLLAIRFVPESKIPKTFIKLKTWSRKTFAVGHKVHDFFKIYRWNVDQVSCAPTLKLVPIQAAHQDQQCDRRMASCVSFQDGHKTLIVWVH